MLEIYRLKVAELEVALKDDSIKAEAGDILRSLIERVVLTPVANALDGIDAQLHGDLAGIPALSNDDDRNQETPGLWRGRESTRGGCGDRIWRLGAGLLGVDARRGVGRAGSERQVHSPTRAIKKAS